MMSPKRDQRVLPQAALVQQQHQQQGYTMQMMSGPQQQQQPPPQPSGLVQYQYQSQAMPGPASYLAQQYVPANSNVGPGPAGILRMGPRMLPVGGSPAVSGMVPGNGVISSTMAPQPSTIRIPVSYYSQQPPAQPQPSMVPIPHQMGGYPVSVSTGVPIQQANPNQAAAAYYGELMQHPLQVSLTTCTLLL